MPQGPPYQLAPPTQGVRGDVAPWQVPEGAAWRLLNMVDRFGRTRTRPGLRAAAATGPGARITGGQFFTTADASALVVAATLDKWYRRAGAGWTDISGAHVFAATETSPTRYTVFPSSGVNWLIGVNNTDDPYKWDGIAAAAVPLGGSPPVAKDITVADNYVVLGNVVESGMRAASRIRISNFNDLDSWDQYGPVDLTSTNDDIVAVRALTRQSFAIYKTRSQWVAWAELGLFPFRLEPMDYEPGPCSPSAIVRQGQQHWYLGTDTRIYHFDGFRAEAVSRAAEYYLQTHGLPTSFRSINRDRAWGTYTALDRRVWFFFPGPTSSDPVLALSLNVDTRTIAPHIFPFPVSAGWEGDDVSDLSWDDLLIYPDWVGGAFEATYPSWDSFGGTLEPSSFVGSVDGQVYRLQYDADDGGHAIPQICEFPIRGWYGMDKSMHLDGVESWFRQVPNGPAVRIDIGISDALAEPVDPNYVTLGYHDTALATRQKFNDAQLNGRFMSVRLAATGGPVEFLGGLANGWPEEAAEHGTAPEAVVNVLPGSIVPDAGATLVLVTGVFTGNYMVAIETSWPTQYGIPEETRSLTQFTIELGTPCPPGGVIRYKVITE